MKTSETEAKLMIMDAIFPSLGTPAPCSLPEIRLPAKFNHRSNEIRSYATSSEDAERAERMDSQMIPRDSPGG